MNNILVTGAKGMLGQDLCVLLKHNKFNVIETDHTTLDITDEAGVKKVIKSYMPDCIIHCAAYTNVEKAEDNLEIAHDVNANGTKNIAKICAEINIPIVYISTDYVFDGNKTTPYMPEDIPHPINNYGLTKYQGEVAVQKFCAKHYIIRTSWLYGVYGNNFIEKILSNINNSNLKIVDDQIGCPTWTVDLSKYIIDLISSTAPYGIYHMCNSGQTSWHGFAKEVFRQMNETINLEACSSDDFISKVKRPKYSVLGSNNVLYRNWQLALSEYLKLRFK